MDSNPISDPTRILTLIEQLCDLPYTEVQRRLNRYVRISAYELRRAGRPMVTRRYRERSRSSARSDDGTPANSFLLALSFIWTAECRECHFPQFLIASYLTGAGGDECKTSLSHIITSRN